MNIYIHKIQCPSASVCLSQNFDRYGIQDHSSDWAETSLSTIAHGEWICLAGKKMGVSKY